MTPNPVAMPAETTLIEAAKSMRDRDVGDVLVLDGEKVRGVVTDRDLVVRGLAENRDVTSTPLSEICSSDLVTLPPDAGIDEAARVMRERSVRRVPIVEGDRAVGILSL